MLFEYRSDRCPQQRGKSSAAAYNRVKAVEGMLEEFAMATDIRKNDNMGRVLTEITVENLKDVYDAERGLIPQSEVRRVSIPDAVVDTGATFLSLPTRVIRQLGLSKVYSKRVTTSKGPADSDVYNAVWFTLQGRSCTLDVMEVPDSVPALVGQLPLEHLDFVVDPVGQKVIGNPAHGGEQMYDLL
jgi:predicted aspartyl protease